MQQYYLDIDIPNPKLRWNKTNISLPSTNCSVEYLGYSSSDCTSDGCRHLHFLPIMWRITDISGRRAISFSQVFWHQFERMKTTCFQWDTISTLTPSKLDSLWSLNERMNKRDEWMNRYTTLLLENLRTRSILDHFKLEVEFMRSFGSTCSPCGVGWLAYKWDNNEIKCIGRLCYNLDKV